MSKGTLMPFGKHKDEVVEEIPDGYLRWLCYQDWFEDKWPGLLEKIEEELRWREHYGEHIND